MIRMISAASALLLVFTACGGGEDAGTADSPRVITITAKDFSFTPAMIEVSEGETVEFVVLNQGAVEHEFRVMNQHDIDAHIEAGHADHEEEPMENMEDGTMAEGMNMDAMIAVGAGQTGRLTVTFPADRTVFTNIVCLIPGHYEAGMKGDVSYTG